MNTLSALIIAAAIIVTGLLLYWLLNRSLRRNDSMSLLQNQVNAATQQSSQQVEALRKGVADSLQALTSQLNQSLATSSKQVGDRLDSTTKIIGDVRQQLGQLEKSSKRMLEVGTDIAHLQEILQPPKLRGSLGELFLGDLLAQVVPASHYELQHHFKGGEVVDAVVTLRAGMVPIDAKFPLDNFKRVLAAESDDDRRTARRAFARDVKGHIDAIAKKYIRMDEGTFDFALMYIPAENVYYETIIKDELTDGDMVLFNYALKRRVIPVSPNSFYAYLQTVILGLKGMQVEEQSREIIGHLSRLRKEFDTFSEAFRLVGQHLDNSGKKFTEAQKRLGKMESKIEQIDGMAQGLKIEDAPETPALPESPA
ncbi:MAG: DNA recombination protein RmuC [Kiritimatiellae bacterium]|nr:DNA recombination protein RmuC [Kiritimatiellia bacterium]